MKENLLKLIITTPQGKQFDFPFDKKSVTIGRDKHNNDVVLHDERVSRHHALFEKNGETCSITDLKSSNGTFINGVQLKKGGIQSLNDGDEVKLGNHKLLFKVTKKVSYDDNPIGKTALLQSAAEMLRTALYVADAPQVSGSFAPATSSKAGAQPAAIDTELLTKMEFLSKRSRILGYVYELNKALSTAFTAQAVYEKVSEQIFKVSDCGRIVFAALDGDETKIEWMGNKDSVVQCVYEGIPVSRTIIKRVIQDRVSLSSDSASDPAFKSNPTLLLGRIGAVMCAPLLGQNDLAIGAIYVDRLENRLGAPGFSEEDLNFLTAVASNAATTIENIHAHESLIRDAEARLTYLRFLPPFVVDQIMANPGSIELGGVNQTVTMLFADIRGFTTLSERKKPQEIVVLLNNYFERAADAIFRFNGTLDKFIGDGIMALFGAPKPSTSDPANAIQAAIAIQRVVKEINQELETQDADFKIEVGIGINTGEVTAGYIGSRLRTDYTVIGDAVNLAARLESNARPGQILISEQTYNCVREFMISSKDSTKLEEGNFTSWKKSDPKKVEFTMRPMGGLMVKGKTKSVQVYRVFWNDMSSDESDALTLNTGTLIPYNGPERRKEPRIDLRIKLYISGIDTEGKRFDAECTTENISLSGASLTNDSEIPAGYKFFLWGEDGFFQAQAEVRHVRLVDSLYKIGVHFLSTSHSIWQIK